MIKLEDHRTSLVNLKGTIEALEDIDKLIEFYSVDKPGPAYTEFHYVDNLIKPQVQFERSIMVTALRHQRQRLADYLATLGIEA